MPYVHRVRVCRSRYDNSMTYRKLLAILQSLGDVASQFRLRDGLLICTMIQYVEEGIGPSFWHSFFHATWQLDVKQKGQKAQSRSKYVDTYL